MKNHSRRAMKERSRSVWTTLLTIGVFAVTAAYAQADDLLFVGSLIQHTSYDFDAEEIGTVEIEASAEVSTPLGEQGFLLLSGEARHDYATNTAEVGFGEAYTVFYLAAADVTVGNQIVNWGTADGLNPTSVINPLIPRSLVEENVRWSPVPALRVTYFAGTAFDVTAVVVLAGSGMDTDFLSESINGSAAETLPDYPTAGRENFEYAINAATRLGRFDVNANYFYGFDDTPAIVVAMDIDPVTMLADPDSAELRAEYRREHRVGLSAAGELLTLGVWAEGAYVVPEDPVFPDSNDAAVLALSTDENRFEAVVGVDYTFPGGFYAQGQYAYYGPGGLLAPYSHEPGDEPDETHLGMLNLSYDLGASHTLEVQGLYDPIRETGMVQPAIDLRVARATSLRVYGSYQYGNAAGFGELIDSSVGMRLKGEY